MGIAVICGVMGFPLGIKGKSSTVDDKGSFN